MLGPAWPLLRCIDPGLTQAWELTIISVGIIHQWIIAWSTTIHHTAIITMINRPLFTILIHHSRPLLIIMISHYQPVSTIVNRYHQTFTMTKNSQPPLAIINHKESSSCTILKSVDQPPYESHPSGHCAARGTEYLGSMRLWVVNWSMIDAISWAL